MIRRATIAVLLASIAACSNDRGVPHRDARGREALSSESPSAVDESGGLDNAGSYLVDDGTGSVGYPDRPSFTTEDHIFPQPRKEQSTSDSPGIPITALKEELIAKASALPPEDFVALSILLRSDVPTNWQEVRGASSETRRAAVATRKAALEPLQESMVLALREHGAVDIESRWLTNAIYARVPAAHVRAVLSHPDVGEVSGNDPLANLAPWDGDKSTEQTRVSIMYAAGHTGTSGSVFGSHGQIRIAFIDGDSVPIAHPGWGGRVIVRRDCRGAPSCFDVGPRRQTIMVRLSLGPPLAALRRGRILLTLEHTHFNSGSAVATPAEPLSIRTSRMTESRSIRQSRTRSPLASTSSISRRAINSRAIPLSTAAA